MEKIKVGKRVRVEIQGQPDLIGQVKLNAEFGNALTGEKGVEYHVTDENDGHTYRVTLGKDGVKSINEIK